MSAFSVVGLFLVAVIFGFLILFLWLRIAARYFGISSSNQFVGMVYTLTNPVVDPFYKFLRIPISMRYDWGACTVLIVVEFLKIISISLLVLSQIMPFVILIMYVAADLVMQPLNFLFYALIIRIVLSYTNPALRHPVVDVIYRITQPLVLLGRRIVPNISGFDFAPFVMMIILKVLVLFISQLLPGKLL